MPSSKVTILVVIVAIVIVAGAALYIFYPGTPGQATSTSTVKTPANLLASTGHLPADSCGDVAYRNQSLSINWGNLEPGTEGIAYVCLENTGTTSTVLSVSSSLSSSVGSVTSPQSGTPLNGRGITMIELDLHLSSTVQTGPIPSFTITIGGQS